MRVRREAAAGLHLAPEVLEVRFVDAALEKRARVNAGRGMTLEEDDVGVRAVVPAEEVVEADLVERRGRGKRRNVAADSLVGLVGPTTIAAAFQRTMLLMRRSRSGLPGIRAWLVGGNRVDVGRVGAEGQLDAVLGRVQRQLAQQPGHLGRPTALQHIIQRVEPFARFDGVELRGIFGGDVSQGNLVKTGLAVVSLG